MAQFPTPKGSNLNVQWWKTPVESTRKFFAQATDLFTKAYRDVHSRFKLMNTGFSGDYGTWAFNLGFAFARNSASWACWRYEVYFSLGFWTLRIGLRPVYQTVVATGTAQKVVLQTEADGSITIHPSPEPVKVEHVEEFFPDDANERP